jgi:hypothetical protein
MFLALALAATVLRGIIVLEDISLDTAKAKKTSRVWSHVITCMIM